ncbi:MAG: hypothetical protein QMB88_09440, partial [Burkholderiaceae bacterium]
MLAVVTAGQHTQAAEPGVVAKNYAGTTVKASSRVTGTKTSVTGAIAVAAVSVANQSGLEPTVDP